MGMIKTLIGTASATGVDGSQRSLQAGDRVYQDEVITTGSAGAVEIEFADGSIMSLGRSSQTLLNEDMLNVDSESHVLDAPANEVEDLQQALVDGADPTQIGEATAAGAGTTGGNEGVDIVQVAHEAAEVTPESGFETTGIAVEFDERDEEDELQLQVPQTTPPNADPVLTTADSDKLPEGLQLALSELGFGAELSESYSLVGEVTAEVILSSYAQSGQVTNQSTETITEVQIFLGTAGAGVWTYDSNGGGYLGGATPSDFLSNPNYSQTLTWDGLSIAPGDNFHFSNLDADYISSLSPLSISGGGATPWGTEAKVVITYSDGSTSTASFIDQAPNIAQTIDALSDGFNEQSIDVALFKQLAVDGIVGDSDFESADFGGSDAETSLENLVFALDSDPTFGSLILVTASGDSSLMSVGDTFTSADTVWWFATEQDLGQFEGNPPAVTFDYLVTDEDGASASETVTIQLPDNNDNPEVFEQSSIIVDEDGLELGIPGGEDDVSGEDVSVVGTLNYDFGDDGAGDVDFASLDGQVVQATGDGGLQNLTSQGNAVTYIWNAATHTLTGVANAGEESTYDVFSLEVTNIETGAYTFTLLAPVDHPTAETEDDLVLDLPFTVSDFDGDTATGSLQVTIDDDSPVVTPGEPTEFVYELTITNHDEVSSAGYHSSYGYYVKGEGGIPTTGLVIWDDVHDADALETVVVVGYSPEQIGFFIIPNGDNLNPTLSDNTEIEFVQLPSGEWQAVIPGTPSTPLLGAGSNVLFDDDSLNPIDNKDHVQDNELIGNQNWEDLPILTGDGDYNDVNVNVEWTMISETGGDPEINFGADGGPSFTGDISVSHNEGAITSGGEAIFFTLKDINSDGKLDLIGSTNSGSGDVVLTVDDILSDDESEAVISGAGIDEPNGNVTAHIKGALTDSDGDPAVQFKLSVDILLTQPESEYLV